MYAEYKLFMSYGKESPQPDYDLYDDAESLQPYIPICNPVSVYIVLVELNIPGGLENLHSTTVSLLLRCIIYTLFLCFFSAPSLHAKFFSENFTLVSFIFCVPQARTIILNGKTEGQFNTTTLAVNYVCFFRGASCMPPLEADYQMLLTAITL